MQTSIPHPLRKQLPPQGPVNMPMQAAPRIPPIQIGPLMLDESMRIDAKSSGPSSYPLLTREQSIPNPMNKPPYSSANVSTISKDARGVNVLNGDTPPGGPQWVNPLMELIELEQQYVRELSLINEISDLSGAYEQKPLELDVMLKNFQEIFKVNKQFCENLARIGPNPVSPRELGDLLMQWVDEMEYPYTKYCKEFSRGLDMMDQVINNSKLQQKLKAISSQKFHEVTLDYLFNLPLERLYEYKNLYSRLYQSSQPGRTDHDLLFKANQRLDSVLRLANMAREKRPANPSGGKSPEMYFPNGNGHPPPSPMSAYSANESTLSSPSRSPAVSPLPSPMRMDFHHGEEADPIVAFERTINCSYVRDLFTLQPKKCKLQLCPPGMSVRRHIIMRGDLLVNIDKKFEPATGAPVNHRGHVVLLNDLLLICRRATAPELSEMAGVELFLLYPPLAVRHIYFAPMDVSPEDMRFEVVVMKKERFIMSAASRDSRNQWLLEAERCGLILESDGMTSFQRMLNNRQTGPTTGIKKPLMPTQVQAQARQQTKPTSGFKTAPEGYYAPPP
ncbi:uncharacterized protein VTP21DRAFT_859 [Calcarisporiella thermophila]|uniref:uncharacterized protein n=1 Tax=Calcarisporiella thermophila TaxID=911321 RepID=UPI003743074F